MISDIIFYLLRSGAHTEPKRITTGELAENIGVSQQTASRKLISLERGGLIKRVEGKILLTDKAIVEVRRLLREVSDALSGLQMSFAGTVVPGLGAGAFFCSQAKYISQMKEKLGFKPFCGTLNIYINAEEVDKRIVLRQQKPILISGFKKGARTFGKLDSYRCVVNGLQCALIFPEHSQHGLQVLELVSSVNLRKKLSLVDGSHVAVEIVPN